MYIESICYKRPQDRDGMAFSINLTNLHPNFNVIVGKNDTNKHFLIIAMWSLKRLFDNNIDDASCYYEIVFVESPAKYRYVLKKENYYVQLEMLTCLNDNSVIFERNFDGIVKSKDNVLEEDMPIIDGHDLVVGILKETLVEIVAIDKFMSSLACQKWSDYPNYSDCDIIYLPLQAFKQSPQDFQLPEQFKCSGALQSRLGFILFLLYAYDLKRKENKLPLVWLDSVGCGLDFEENRRIGHLIYEQYAVNNQDTQFFMTTHEREILNAIPIEYWQILEKSEQGLRVYNKTNASEAFDDFEMCGLSNFDLFRGECYKTTTEDK